MNDEFNLSEKKKQQQQQQLLTANE